MQSSNPVFRRSEGFNGRSETYAGNGMTYPAYGSPSAPDAGWSGPQDPFTTQVDQGRMTIDTVVQKTGITLGVVVVAAVLTWTLTGSFTGTPEEAKSTATS